MPDAVPHCSLLDALLPVTCALCGLPGRPVCARCLSRLPAVSATACRTCGHPWSARPDRCAECPRGIAGARHAVPFGPSPGRIVSALKDGGRRDLAGAMARLVAARCEPPAPEAVLVPVPLTPARRSRRGFNQSADLARALGRLWSLVVDADVIARGADAPPQRGAARSTRAAQVRGAFSVRPGSVPDDVWLVDDVHTTGATISACALALRRAGAPRVHAVTFARVVSTAPASTERPVE